VVISTFRVTVNDGSSPQSDCRVFVQVDNQSPPPSCAITPPVGVVSGDIAIDVDAMSFTSPTIDIALEWSSDGGVTYMPCTMAAGSPGPNPRLGALVGVSTFLWDSRGDGAALSGVEGIPVRATVNDGGPITSDCQAVLSVDNGMLCGGICGDCNLNGVGPDVVDALTAAQIAVATIVPTAEQAACCDVNTSGQVDVVDALFIAQAAAGISILLVCA
jgi:hypothetical protein